MSIGCHRELFTIQHKSYRAGSLTQSDMEPVGTQVRVTYEGCDYLCLPPCSRMPDFFQTNILSIPSVSSQTIIKCTIAEEERLFYINKATRQVIELYPGNIKCIENLARRHKKDESIVYYQPECIAMDDIKSIADNIRFSSLYTNAKRAKNIELKLSAEQRRRALMMMDDNNINFRNTSYT